MALLYNDEPDAFGIVSSDADFTPLVMHLREKGAAVYGFGERKTPEPFRSACTKFLYLDQLAEPDEVRLDEAPLVEPAPQAASEPQAASAGASAKTAKAAKKSATKTAAKAAPKVEPSPARRTTAELRNDGGLVRLLRNAVARAAADDDDGWASVAAVGNRISNQSSFDARNHGYSSLSKLLKATELFDVRIVGNVMTVRDKRLARKAT
jgi:uncharacterized LabA/DUF88 family protein